MDKPTKIESKFSFEGYQVNKIEFYTNTLFQNSEPIQVDFKFSVGVEVLDEDQKVKVTLGVEVFKDANLKNYPFSMSVLLTGIFKSEDAQTHEQLQKLGEVNETAILFPFLRNIVAEVCVNANFTPIMLPIINVYNFIEQQKKNQPEVLQS